MKQLIVNRKITVLIFTVMFLVCGIVGFGYAHFDSMPHFHADSTTRSVPEGAAGGTSVDGGPVAADNFNNSTLITGDPRYRYVLRGTDATFFQINRRL